VRQRPTAASDATVGWEWSGGALRTVGISMAKVAGARGVPVVDGWLDLTSLVTSGAKDNSGNELAEKLGDEVYADINGWKLYLKDMKIHNAVAVAVSNRLSDGMDVDEAIKSTLARVPVKLGKKKDVPLMDLVPSMVVDDTVRMVKEYLDDAW